MINVIISADPRYSANKLTIQATVLEVLKRHRITGNVQLGIAIVGDRRMHQINKQYRDLDTTTNILSFALEDPIPQDQLQHIPRVGFVKSPDKILRLGDILISYPQAVKDASLDGISVEEELRFLVEHGVRHLLGIHDH